MGHIRERRGRLTLQIISYDVDATRYAHPFGAVMWYDGRPLPTGALCSASGIGSLDVTDPSSDKALER